MERKVQEKNKYIIYNEEGKVLVFTSPNKNKTKISMPGVVLTGCCMDEQGFNKDVSELLLTEDITYLQQDVSSMPIFVSHNCKLQKTTLKMIRNYYCCYKEFSKKDYEDIMKLCYEYGYIPHFLTIEELKNLIDKRAYNINIDCSMYDSLEELDKRLKFIRY